MTSQSRELVDLEAALRSHYALERELGRGGMGVVFLARDLKLDRDVAIKALPLHLADDPRVRERFLREARTAARLSHPNIVPIHRADEIDGRVFFVMGYVDGESIAQRVATQGALPSAALLPLLCDVAEALGEAHRHGIVHRDVKAENILIDRRTGRAMVTDFGIARVAEAAPLTATGLLLGTVQYMSPEQVVGELVDARSDIYALGVVAFFALTGQFPFQSETASAVLVAHVTKTAPKVRDVQPAIPERLALAVDRCLEKEPANRFQTAEELGRELRDIAGDEGVRLTALPTPRAATSAARSDELLSNDEAEEVWERAARLQAQVTGTVAAPPIRPAGQVLSPSSAYRVDVVRESAREAGIATEYVDRALAERGYGAAAVARLEPSLTPLPAEVRDIRDKPVSPWVETIRRVLSDPGIVGAMGRSFTWSASDPKRRVHVTVHVRHGRTTLRVSEALRQTVASVFGGGVGGFGGGVGGPTLGILLGATGGAVEIALPAALAVVGTAYAGTRAVYKRIVRSRERELRRLLDRLADDARQSIETRSDERGRPAVPRR
jgi:serine/threonine-protein kinase